MANAVFPTKVQGDELCYVLFGDTGDPFPFISDRFTNSRLCFYILLSEFSEDSSRQHKKTYKKHIYVFVGKPYLREQIQGVLEHSSAMFLMDTFSMKKHRTKAPLRFL